MDNGKHKALSPARNAATYPTLKELGGARRTLLAGVGAAALVVGVGACGGAMVPEYASDAAVGADSGVAVADTGVQREPTDAGVEGGDR